MSPMADSTNTAPERITPERLREHADNISPGGHVYPSDVLRAAADEIEQTRREGAVKASEERMAQ